MSEKLKSILDNRATWATFGVLAGTLLGEKAASAVNGLGLLVMALI